MSNSIDALDHVVIATRDLDAARDRIVRLGFTLTPRGHHTRLGTANHTAMFARGNYLELLGFTRSLPENELFERALAGRDEAVSAVVPNAATPEATRSRLEGTGFRPGEPISFSRAVATPEGERDARFTIVPFAAGSTPVTSAFACCHHTTDLVWMPDMVKHPNGVSGLRRLGYRVADPDAVAATYAELFGASVSRGTAETRVAVRDVDLVFTAAVPGEADSVAVLGFVCDDVAALAQLLQEQRIPFERSGETVAVEAARAVGARFEFAPG